jgi:hypothetical protein
MTLNGREVSGELLFYFICFILNHVAGLKISSLFVFILYDR